MIMLNEQTTLGLQLLFILIAGTGVGMLFHTPFGILTELMPPEDLAGVTGAFFLVRFIGATTGLASAAPYVYERGTHRTLTSPSPIRYSVYPFNSIYHQVIR
jgi:hypothetical protein